MKAQLSKLAHSRTHKNLSIAENRSFKHTSCDICREVCVRVSCVGYRTLEPFLGFRDDVVTCVLFLLLTKHRCSFFHQDIMDPKIIIVGHVFYIGWYHKRPAGPTILGLLDILEAARCPMR